MLTCKVGEKTIKTFEYTDEQIRKWSNKGILKCPVCGSQMIYRNGEIKIAHFAHCKDADCEDIYSESETEEHLNGKKMLYEWLSKQEGIFNLKLEAWIPETKQRPDLYFEIGGERFVMEFQCTPIATEYIQRHRLYQLAGIRDLWILGTTKYNIEIFSTYVAHSDRLKEIENYNYPYFDVNTNNFILLRETVEQIYKPKFFNLSNFNKHNIDNIIFSPLNTQLSINNVLIEEYKERDARLEIERNKKEQRKFELSNLVEFLNERYEMILGRQDFSFYSGNSSYYLYSITYSNNYNTYVFYIKDTSIDFTEEYSYTTPFRGKRGGLGWRRCTGHSKASSIEYEFIDIDVIKDFIIEEISKVLRRRKYPEYYA